MHRIVEFAWECLVSMRCNCSVRIPYCKKPLNFWPILSGNGNMFFTQKLHVQKENNGDILLNPLVIHCTLTCINFTIFNIFSHIGCWSDHSALYTRTSDHGLMNHKDTKAKCRHLKKLTCSLYTERGGESWAIEKVRGATVHKAGSKIPTCLTVSPVYNFDKHLPQTLFAESIFLDDYIVLWCLYS